MRLPWSRHGTCVPEVDVCCVHPGCARGATHARPLGVTRDGELVEELTCCRHERHVGGRAG
ncbi:hypothetical protein [Kribbella sp. NPDC004536]|uniref:hypothetical protein n=1 Tax=Kribbella sp. NPDC004536 TaxID=3364106 RepID=UPI00368483ED